MKLGDKNLALTIGARLLERRRTLGILQKDLASLATVSVHTLSNIESGKGNPSLDVIERLLLCLGLQCTIEPQRLDDSANPPGA
ncbi:MAG: helix-turn-helix transcriptional regulator [Prosthecobacter sp.]|uniref:helix-turn-helix transcriptional regulator n=1 Tax=Prosthecobacter sp. TaxID=1965333 RepID=UPI00390328B9